MDIEFITQEIKRIANEAVDKEIVKNVDVSNYPALGEIDIRIKYKKAQ